MNNINNIGMNFLNMNENIAINNIPMNSLNNMPPNNLAMNNIIMNNMPMNNIPMNNQQNLIEFYQNQIKQLEEIIRQKELQITYLKNLLNMNGVNYQYQNFMNINPIGVMNNLPVKKKEVVVTFIDGNRNEKYKCFENDVTYKLFEKINLFPNYNLIKYTCNGKKLHLFLTLKENGIKDGSIIEVGKTRTIFFNGYKERICINIDEDYPLKKAIKLYLLKIGEENYSDEFKFLFNSKVYNIRNKTPIKDIFSSSILSPIAMTVMR